ncbi:MAG: hypothetical protein KDA85_01825 [Planctomycetaceae bacterium]|nr:hypothetical protein [Planctomycetaceae bacterium]
MIPREHIPQQALSLPPSDLAFVADMIERRIAESEQIPPQLDAAWSKEIDRWGNSYVRGKSTGVDFADSLTLMRKALAAHRGAQNATSSSAPSP